MGSVKLVFALAIAALLFGANSAQSKSCQRVFTLTGWQTRC